MKRILFFLLLPIFALTGCHQTETPFSPFKEDAIWDIAFEDLRFTITTSPGVSDSYISFTEPEILKELTVKIRSDGLFAEFGEIKVPISESFIGNVFPLYKAIQILCSSDILSAEQNGIKYRAFKNDDGSIAEIEVKGTDGKTVVYTVLSAVKNNDNSKSPSQDPS